MLVIYGDSDHREAMKHYVQNGKRESHSENQAAAEWLSDACSRRDFASGVTF